MKYIIIVLLTGCSSTQYKENLCLNHKEDYMYYLNKFNIEHKLMCYNKNDCVYTETMNHNSDEYERIAGIYYLSNCDTMYGRL